MGGIQCVRGLEAYINNVGGGESVTFRSRGKVGAIHVLHGDEMDAVRLTNLVDVSDVRVVDGGCRFRLTEETRPALLALRKLWGKDLEGHRPVELVSRARYTSPIPPAPMASTIL